MSILERPYLRLFREPRPLGAYVRPLERDHSHTAALISAGFRVGTGIVIDACHPSRSRDLRSCARDARLEVVLDPRSVELSTEGGIERSGVRDLPWSSGDTDTPSDFTAYRVDEYACALAEKAIDLRATAVLAPTHYVEAPLTQWFDIDLGLAAELRRRLDQDPAGRSIRVYYPLVSSLAALHSDAATSRAVEGLKGLAAKAVIDAVWIRMHGFGTNLAGPLTLQRYIRLARALHSVGMPLVAERTGTVGLPLMAFGAVVGIESGITHGERFQYRDLVKPRDRNQKGGLAPRVYFPAIGAFLTRKQAEAFLNSRGMKGTFGCQLNCCPAGVTDMLREARRHFLVTRSEEVQQLASVPDALRVEHFFSTWAPCCGRPSY